MSTATMAGSDAVKASGSKQQLKSSGSGKQLDGARKQAASPVESSSRKQQQPPQPKAWTGTNPITQRASSNLPNGTEKPLPKVPTQPQTKTSTEPHVDKHAHDRALFILANFTGHDATLTLKNGEQFTGVFSGASLESNSKHQYILKMVKRTRLPAHQQINGNTELPDEYIGEGEDHVMAFDKDDTVDLAVSDVVTANAQPMQNGSITSSFRTDTEISARDSSMPRERELQRWDAGVDSSIDMSLEGSGKGDWDQFAENERRYGVQSTYDENFYTTAIDRSNPLYKRREADAERIAREIEGSTPATAHVAEERRRDAERGDGVDEEEKYSGVRREATALPKRTAGAYVPPSQRPITNAPTVRGAPFDPAIISSQLAKSTSPPQSAEKAAEALAAQSALPVEDQKTVPLEESTKDGEAAQAQISKKPAENTTEDHVRNVTDSFKQFANNEKLRMRALQEQKRQFVRHEKNVKLNDLKKFAANFKLKSRVPDDLVPILAKEKHKQVEIQHKAEEAAKEEAAKAKEREDKASASSATASPSSSQVGPGTDRAMSFNQAPPRTARLSGNLRGMPAQSQAQPRQPPAQAVMAGNRGYNRSFPQPLPADMRIPTGPAVAPVAPVAPVPPPDAGPMSPTSATRLNVNAKAFEFRPAAHSFTPSGTSPSPQRTAGSSSIMESSAGPETATFFDKDKKQVDAKDRKDFKSAFQSIKRVAAECTEDQKKTYAPNGGIPQPYRTPPTWQTQEANINVSYKDSLQKTQAASQGPSPMHTPNPNLAQMPHAHQLPQHLQGQHMPTPSQRPPYMAPPPHPNHPQGYDPRMGQFGPNGSVQSSPRFQQPQVAYPGQMPGMPMPQFPGQQMQGYGMSPSMGYRQVQMPPQGPMMMMGPQQGHGQMPPMPQGYPRGSQFGQPPIMAGVPMVNQPSGGFMNGPMPQQQSYSPMPPHPQPHMPPHMQQPPSGPAGYNGSPRPHMMQHSGSHQGFQPGMMGSPYAPSPGHPHAYHMQHRQMSHGGGYPPQMTPRQQQAMPVQHQPSPGMGAGQPGDEGK